MSLTVTQLSKSFETGIEIFQDISFGIDKGEIAVVRGPSGTGKTTLLHCIVGLLKPTIGEVFVNQQNVTSMSPSSRSIGIMMQQQPLYEHLSVKRNLVMALNKTKSSAVEEVVQRFCLEDKTNELVSNLSGGERRRVAFCRAVINAPDVLLLDEPFVSLNEELVQLLVTYIEALHAKQSCSILIATHRNDIDALATQTIQLKNHP